ncbi:MAG: DUF1565 domain-containing protein [Bacteroidales bacterium]|nr:DUF1565 domain-containing protein [Bacteroidales bacterium]MCF8387241.1 DUF1565 domain-containing protein [Bacteroidales bacterium]MCF8396680.1 DUF1565 domain-containing protein [Bacteroidales bacterium]
MKQLMAIVYVLISLQAASQIITVKQDGSGDFTIIQDGIDAATSGDTILVYPGTYYENLKIIDKNLVLGSLTLTTGDESYINQTIIDGNQLSCCINITDNTEKNTICGFTMQNGNGYKFEPNDRHSYGGGLYIRESDIDIHHCVVKNNFSFGHGGGVFIYESNVNIFCCSIDQNNAFYGGGGGISVGYSDIYLSNATVKRNYCSGHGGGIAFVSTNFIWDTLNRCNIYLNHGTTGTDISKGVNCPPLHLVVDTFTVADPDRYYVISTLPYRYPVNDVTYEINAWVVERENQNLYIDPVSGNNENSGLTPDEPLKNINYALLKIVSDSIDPKSIYLADGVYSLASGEKFPMPLRHYVSLIGESRDSTIIDAQDTAYHFEGNPWTKNYSIKNLTLSNGNANKVDAYQGSIGLFDNDNITFENLLVYDNKGKSASAIGIGNSNNVLFKNVDFVENEGQASLGFGISYGNEQLTEFYDTAHIINCRFVGNTGDPDDPEIVGSAFSTSGMDLTRDSLVCYLTNCLFYENVCELPPPPVGLGRASLGAENARVNMLNCTLGNNFTENFAGANMGVVGKGELNVYNSIMYDNDYAEFYMATDPGFGPPALNIYNSIVEGGEENIRIYTNNYHLHYDSSNMNTDPLWDTTGFFPYAPTYGSPCINAGTTDLPEGWEIPETDLVGNPRVYDGQIDMGAYEFGPWVGADYRPPVPPKPQLSASPNPFHHETRIRYHSKEKGKQSIFVYDIGGNVVATVMDITGQPGRGEIIWNGRNDYGRMLPAGLYVVEFVVNEESKGSVKVVKK